MQFDLPPRDIFPSLVLLRLLYPTNWMMEISFGLNLCMRDVNITNCAQVCTRMRTSLHKCNRFHHVDLTKRCFLHKIYSVTSDTLTRPNDNMYQKNMVDISETVFTNRLNDMD